MIDKDTAMARALIRIGRMSSGRQAAFLLAFARARDDVTCGADTEAAWLLTYERHHLAAAAAGYLEGLASTRRMPPRVPTARLRTVHSSRPRYSKAGTR